MLSDELFKLSSLGNSKSKSLSLTVFNCQQWEFKIKLIASMNGLLLSPSNSVCIQSLTLSLHISALEVIAVFAWLWCVKWNDFDNMNPYLYFPNQFSFSKIVSRILFHKFSLIIWCLTRLFPVSVLGQQHTISVLSQLHTNNIFTSRVTVP